MKVLIDANIPNNVWLWEKRPEPEESAQVMEAEAEANNRESAMWKRIREIIKDCDGPERLAEDLEELIHLTVVKGGAEGDGLNSEDCNTLYWPWELMRALRMRA